MLILIYKSYNLFGTDNINLSLEALHCINTCEPHNTMSPLNTHQIIFEINHKCVNQQGKTTFALLC